MFGTTCRPCIQVSILRHKRTSQFNIADSFDGTVSQILCARAGPDASAQGAPLYALPTRASLLHLRARGNTRWLWEMVRRFHYAQFLTATLFLREIRAG